MFPLLRSLALFVLSAPAAWAEDLTVQIEYLAQADQAQSLLSRLMQAPENEGLAGAELAIRDNRTTGQFLGHTYMLNAQIGDDADAVLAMAAPLIAQVGRAIVLNLDANLMRRVTALPGAGDDLFVNAGSRDDTLRAAACQLNLLHTRPSRIMLADALMQFFVSRRWTDLMLVEGPRDADALWAAALRDSAAKFGLEVMAERPWLEDADLRRSAAQEVPVLTQARGYDVVVVADEARDFGQFLEYNTWLPRPVAGSAGLRPVGFAPVLEQWGAVQLQTRFGEVADRPITEEDYAVWAAVRALGEAVTRTGQTEVSALRTYMLSDAFELAGFKGRPMSFRPWDGQMRQPIALVHAEAVVAMAPLPGFLHPVTELDTLGIDAAQSTCQTPPGDTE